MRRKTNIWKRSLGFTVITVDNADTKKDDDSQAHYGAATEELSEHIDNTADDVSELHRNTSATSNPFAALAIDDDEFTSDAYSNRYAQPDAKTGRPDSGYSISAHPVPPLDASTELLALVATAAAITPTKQASLQGNWLHLPMQLSIPHQYPHWR
jgi:hypothetical protein